MGQEITMETIPSVSAQIDEKKIFKIIDNNFSKLAPYYYTMMSNWLIRAYAVHKDIDKYLIMLYLINQDLIVFRRNGLIINYETFYKDRSLEIDKIIVLLTLSFLFCSINLCLRTSTFTLRGGSILWVGSSITLDVLDKPSLFINWVNHFV